MSASSTAICRSANSLTKYPAQQASSGAPDADQWANAASRDAKSGSFTFHWSGSISLRQQHMATILAGHICHMKQHGLIKCARRHILQHQGVVGQNAAEPRLRAPKRWPQHLGHLTRLPHLSQMAFARSRRPVRIAAMRWPRRPLINQTNRSLVGGRRQENHRAHWPRAADRSRAAVRAVRVISFSWPCRDRFQT